MAKTAAEKQRLYRERQKTKGPEFLEKERQGVAKYYVPAAQLSKRKLDQRNQKAKMRNRLCRQRKQQFNNQALDNQDVSDTSGYGSMQVEDSDSHTPLIVRLPSVEKRNNNKATGIKKTQKRALARAHKSIKDLKIQIDNLRRKMKTKNKQIERLRKKPVAKKNKKQSNGETATCSSTSTLSTPVRQAKDDLGTLSAEMTPRRQKRVKRKLILGNALINEIRTSRQNATLKTRRPLHSIIAGGITKKYRLISALSKATGFSRNSLLKCKSKNFKPTKEVRKSLTKVVQGRVEAFLTREDNCRLQPGKADTKKLENGEKKQTVVLTDYMRTLHLKFISENPTIKLSLASFCRLRPQHVLLASFIARNACLCIRHQNMALKVNALRRYGVNVNKNPESIIEEMDNLDNLLSNLPEKVDYKTWKRVQVQEANREVMKMKVIDESMSKEEFLNSFKKDVTDLSEHVRRVQAQYHQLRTLKENLQQHEFILQMDFAENFACRSLNEPQTAYWNQTSITLHPVVIYYREGNDLKHKSVVVISDETNHSASVVCAFIDAVIPKVKEIDDHARKIHYWTDSPSSQYRNRFIFNTVASHENLYGIRAQWNFFEAGHGKGPCDGLGGTTKRMADEAIRQGKAIIQDAKDFHKWALSNTMKEVDFIFVEKVTCEKKKEDLGKTKIKPVKDTMKLHAVVGLSSSLILTRTTSCYCDLCRMENYCETWTRIQIENAQHAASTNCQQVDHEATPVADKDTEHLPSDINENRDTENDTYVTAAEIHKPAVIYSEGQFVACVYNNDWFIGKIVDIDHEDSEVEVNFMEKTKELYRWPYSEDKIWIPASDVLIALGEPCPSGKSKRNFRIPENELKLVKTAFEDEISSRNK